MQNLFSAGHGVPALRRALLIGGALFLPATPALAQDAGVSLRTLHRQLKQHTGMTPQRYLNRLRLIKARHLLRHTDESVTDIAYCCGFGDSNHFSTLFRREFNWSPRDIRQGKDAMLQ